MHADTNTIGHKRTSSRKDLEIKQSLNFAQTDKEVIPSNTESYPKPPIGRVMVSVPRSLDIQHRHTGR